MKGNENYGKKLADLLAQLGDVLETTDEENDTANDSRASWKHDLTQTVVFATAPGHEYKLPYGDNNPLSGDPGSPDQPDSPDSYDSGPVDPSSDPNRAAMYQLAGDAHFAAHAPMPSDRDLYERVYQRMLN